MTAPPRLAVSERNAALMLDLSLSLFRELVADKALPPAKRIGDVERWLVADLQAILDGRAALPEVFEDIEL